ncbi:hypothetical protein ABPG73_004621 [Tetrahymena malaccensis]
MFDEYNFQFSQQNKSQNFTSEPQKEYNKNSHLDVYHMMYPQSVICVHSKASYANEQTLAQHQKQCKQTDTENFQCLGIRLICYQRQLKPKIKLTTISTNLTNVKHSYYVQPLIGELKTSFHSGTLQQIQSQIAPLSTFPDQITQLEISIQQFSAKQQQFDTEPLSYKEDYINLNNITINHVNNVQDIIEKELTSMQNQINSLPINPDPDLSVTQVEFSQWKKSVTLLDQKIGSLNQSQNQFSNLFQLVSRHQSANRILDFNNTLESRLITQF